MKTIYENKSDRLKLYRVMSKEIKDLKDKNKSLLEENKRLRAQLKSHRGEAMKCEECGSTDEVIKITEYWSCGGRNCFDFNWEKIKDADMPLCQDCENNLFLCCEECGCFISTDCTGGMEEYDDDDNFIGHRCPGCGKLT